MSGVKPEDVRPNCLTGNCCICIPPDELVAVECWGTYKGTRKGGFQCLGCDVGGNVIKVKKVSTRLQECLLYSETKTKDNVFLELGIAVQVEVDPSRGYEAIYKLKDPLQQIESYVADVVRGTVPKLRLDELFESKDDIANAVKERLQTVFSDYGFKMHNVLVTDLQPDTRVKDAMNEIDANRRLRMAMLEKAEAYKIRVVKSAEGDADAQFLQGQGIARQRMAIVNGLVNAVAGNEKMSQNEVQELMLITNYFDTLEKLADGKNTTVFMPHSVGYLGQVASEIKDGTSKDGKKSVQSM